MITTEQLDYAPCISIEQVMARDYLKHRMKKLNKAQRHCVIAYHICGQTIEEIAKELNTAGVVVEIALRNGMNTLACHA